jgi:phosphoserine phosphatase RsbU/P
VTETKPGPSEAYYAALADDDPDDLYEHAPCGYLSALPDGTIVKVNATFLELTGFERGDLVGRRRFVDLLTAGGRIYHETHYAPLLRMQGSVHEIAVEVVAADGRRLPVLLNSVLRNDEDGHPMMIRTAVFDATERRSYERELLEERRRAEEAGARARELAQTLQSSLIPPDVPEVPGVDVAAVYRPAGDGTEVGGDFYDVFETPDESWAIVLGDVCGKGVDAARVTALARYTVRAAAMRTSSPCEVLATLNEALLRQHAGRFCTAAYLRLQPGVDGTVEMTVASGGHPLPLVVGPDGRVRTIGRTGHLLGVFDEVAIDDTSIELAPGESVVLYTDGVTEARSAAGFFGEERLSSLVSSCAGWGATETADRIVDEVLSHQGGGASDDIAVAVVRVPERDS